MSCNKHTDLLKHNHRPGIKLSHRALSTQMLSFVETSFHCLELLLTIVLLSLKTVVSHQGQTNGIKNHVTFGANSFNSGKSKRECKFTLIFIF